MALVAGEIELIGSNDHTRAEVIEVLDLAAKGRIDLSAVITETVELSGRGDQRGARPARRLWPGR